MNTNLLKTMRIWTQQPATKDCYADFTAEFDYSGDSNVTIDISADSNYVLYVNGNFVESGQYPDFPHYKVYDNVDITGFCTVGKNRVDITVWYYGESNMSYYVGEASLWFNIFCGGECVAYSCSDTLSRVNPSFVSGRAKNITEQLGFGFDYDMSAPTDTPYTASRELKGQLPMNVRPVKKLVVGEPCKSECIKQKEGTYFLYDLGCETVGYLDIKLVSSVKQHITVAFGEHIVDGGVRRIIGSRDFSVELTVNEGINEYVNYFRRLGLRYLELWAEQPVTVERFTVRPCDYPLNKIPRNFGNDLRNRIYDVSVRTLELCMHDHYEDCPWREQALYAMDSRNQMLCGYYAFEEYAFPEACLYLMSRDDRADGQLSICTPSGNDLTIPSFCLHYFTEVWEYTDYSGDASLARNIYPKLQSILNVFTGRMINGLVPCFTGNEYWNFYEWRNGLDGRPRGCTDIVYDCALNCLLSVALQNMQKIANAIGKPHDFTPFVTKINDAINEKFLNTSTGLYKNSDNSEIYSELCQSLAVLCGAAKDKGIIAKSLTDCNSGLTPVTLSMLTFKYDALLDIDREGYKEYILSDIDSRYSRMLDAGATSFWETELGEKDFHDAGSLCHGWSAMPVYYYSVLL